jgi:hypothetical protein
MTAYLVMMSMRLLEMHRVLKPTGSLYLHCDRRTALALFENRSGCGVRKGTVSQ